MEKVIVEDINESYVYINCSPSVSYELREYFSFKVPNAHFMPSVRNKIWDGYKRLFDVRTNTIYKGLICAIEDFCKSREYIFKYKTTSNTKIENNELYDFVESLGLVINPRDYQIKGFHEAITNKRCLILSPTASGKSYIIYMIIRYLMTKKHDKILLVVPQISLVSQMYKDFIDYGFDSENMIHKIYEGQPKQTEKQIIISTWQSLYTQPKQYFEQFGSIIVDECHLAEANSLTKIMTNSINANFRIGTTGTLRGTKTNEMILRGLFGPIKTLISTKELINRSQLANLEIDCILLKHDIDSCRLMKNAQYKEEIEYLVLNEQRNKFIRNLVCSLTENTLVLFQYVEKHGKVLYEIIKDCVVDRNVFFIYGGTDVEDREKIREIMEREKNAIIVASYGVYAQGINIKNLHNLVSASPSKSRIRVLQSIGRVLRTSDNKFKAKLYDIGDDLRITKRENHTLKHFQERIGLYGEENFPFKIFKVQLKDKKDGKRDSQ